MKMHELNSQKSSPIKRYVKPLLLITILVVALVAHRLGWIDMAAAHAYLETHAGQWWAPLALIVLKTVMYAFALPASTLILLAGSFYSPWVATLITVVGGVIGGLAAYALVRFLSPDFVNQRTGSSGIDLLRRHAGFLELSALRTFPGFPHSMINYSAGALQVGVWVFATSTAIGLTLKGYVYTAAVHNQIQAGSATDRFTWQTLWPLAAWAVLLIAGALLKQAWSPTQETEQPHNAKSYR